MGFYYFLIGIAEMFAEEGYDLILGFRENINAAQKFKTQLLQKYESHNVKIICKLKMKHHNINFKYLIIKSCIL